MSRNRKSKMLIILILLVCVIFLGVGFSAFSSTLTISSRAIITPDANTFNVSFSTKSDSFSSGTVSPSNQIYGESASLTETTISGIKTKFTEPGQSVSYSFYVINNGKYDAYLNNISIGSKTCTPITGTTDSMVQDACNGIKLQVNYGVGSSSNVLSTYTSLSNISNNVISQNNSLNVTIYIEYESTAARADGDFTVEFGDIIFDYSTVD